MPKAIRASATIRAARRPTTVETLAIERAKQLFGCGFANVQPHSGAQANGAVMLALIKPGDTIMGLSLDAGGHLTHGAQARRCRANGSTPSSMASTPTTHLIDFDQVERAGARASARS